MTVPYFGNAQQGMFANSDREYQEYMRQLREKEEYERQYRNQQASAYYSLPPLRDAMEATQPVKLPVATHVPGAERRRSTILLLKEEE